MFQTRGEAQLAGMPKHGTDQHTWVTRGRLWCDRVCMCVLLLIQMRFGFGVCLLPFTPL